ncbi:unnamed protein product [Ectocarpus sp. 12 AP-2014]
MCAGSPTPLFQSTAGAHAWSGCPSWCPSPHMQYGRCGKYSTILPIRAPASRSRMTSTRIRTCWCASSMGKVAVSGRERGHVHVNRLVGEYDSIL